MIYGINDIKQINCRPNWEVQWGWSFYSRQEVQAMRSQLPAIHHIEDAIIWQSDGSPIEVVIRFWVRQWEHSAAETDDTLSSVMVIGHQVSSEDDSGIEMEELGAVQEMV